MGFGDRIKNVGRRINTKDKLNLRISEDSGKVEAYKRRKENRADAHEPYKGRYPKCTRSLYEPDKTLQSAKLKLKRRSQRRWRS